MMTSVFLYLMLNCPVDQAIQFGDDRAVIEWYQRAAASGSAPAMAEMGVLFERRGNYACAFKWY